MVKTNKTPSVTFFQSLLMYIYTLSTKALEIFFGVKVRISLVRGEKHTWKELQNRCGQRKTRNMNEIEFVREP